MSLPAVTLNACHIYSVYRCVCLHLSLSYGIISDVSHDSVVEYYLLVTSMFAFYISTYLHQKSVFVMAHTHCIPDVLNDDMILQALA
jgi:hypothetical protein